MFASTTSFFYRFCVLIKNLQSWTVFLQVSKVRYCCQLNLSDLEENDVQELLTSSCERVLGTMDTSVGCVPEDSSAEAALPVKHAAGEAACFSLPKVYWSASLFKLSGRQVLSVIWDVFLSQITICISGSGNLKCLMPFRTQAF